MQIINKTDKTCLVNEYHIAKLKSRKYVDKKLHETV